MIICIFRIVEKEKGKCPPVLYITPARAFYWARAGLLLSPPVHFSFPPAFLPDSPAVSPRFPYPKSQFPRHSLSESRHLSLTKCPRFLKIEKMPQWPAGHWGIFFSRVGRKSLCLWKNAIINDFDIISVALFIIAYIANVCMFRIAWFLFEMLVFVLQTS